MKRGNRHNNQGGNMRTGDAWAKGLKIGERLAKEGVDERALHGGKIKDGYYYSMNNYLSLFACPKGLKESEHQEFMDGIIDGFEAF